MTGFLSVVSSLLLGVSGILLARAGYYTAADGKFATAEFGLFMEGAGAFLFAYWLWQISNALSNGLGGKNGR